MVAGGPGHVASDERHTNRPELMRAIELSRRQKTTLVMPSWIGSPVTFISGLMETGVECCYILSTDVEEM